MPLVGAFFLPGRSHIRKGELRNAQVWATGFLQFHVKLLLFCSRVSRWVHISSLMKLLGKKIQVGDGTGYLQKETEKVI